MNEKTDHRLASTQRIIILVIIISSDTGKLPTDNTMRPITQSGSQLDLLQKHVRRFLFLLLYLCSFYLFTRIVTFSR